MTSEDVLAGGSGYRAQTLATQRASGIGLLRQVRLGDHRVEPAPLRARLVRRLRARRGAPRHARAADPLQRPPSTCASAVAPVAAPHGRDGQVRAQARAALRPARLAVATEPRRAKGAHQVLADLERAEPAHLLVRQAAARAYARMLRVVGKSIAGCTGAGDSDRRVAPERAERHRALRYIRQLYRPAGGAGSARSRSTRTPRTTASSEACSAACAAS